MRIDFDDTLKKFQTSLEELFNLPETNCVTTVEFETGRKYIKVLKCRKFDTGYSSRDLYCFIDKATGDILKPASWSTPAKHARGNIFGSISCCGMYGIAYLR